MQHVAQPDGTPAALALLNRGADPWLIASSTYASILACKDMLHPTTVAGNHLSVQQSSVVGLVGQYFIVTDPAVLRAMEGGAYLDAAALSSLVAFLESLGIDFVGQDYTCPQDLWAAVQAGGYDEYLSTLRSSAPHISVHPDALLTLAKLHATEPAYGPAASRRLSEPARQVSYAMLAQPIGGPNNAYRLTHLSAYSYYSGPKCLSQARDSPSGVAVRLMQICLARGQALDVSVSSYDISLPGLTARKAAEIFRRATDDQGWLIITYGTFEDTPDRGQADYEQRLSEFTATMMLNLPSSPECFRYALGKYYFRLAGPLQALHELLQPAPRNGTEALTLIDQLHSACHGATVGGTASTAPSPPGSKLALSRLCNLIRPHLGAADADQELVTSSLPRTACGSSGPGCARTPAGLALAFSTGPRRASRLLPSPLLTFSPSA